MTLTGWYFESLQRHITRVPTSKGSTDDLRRLDASDSGTDSIGVVRAPPSANGDFPWPAAGAEPFSALIGASSEPMKRFAFFFYFFFNFLGERGESLIVCGAVRVRVCATSWAFLSD